MRGPGRCFAVAILALCWLGLCTVVSLAETRVALVIGNGAYQNAARLPNPTNDASDVAAALKRLGFDAILATDLDKSAMDTATIRFARAAQTAEVALFYYSGHALQFGGVNYLMPVDAKLTDEADLRRLVRVDDILSDLQRARNLRILVLDSCRENPLAEELRRSVGTTRAAPLQRGLARIDSQLGTIVAYSTQAGRTANDGDGRNSPYTASFLRNIEAQEEIGTIFRRIGSDVYESTKRMQLPELSLSVIGEFYLRGKAESKPSSGPLPNSVQKDFEATERVDSVTAWDAFLKAHSDGLYADLAKERRALAAAKLAKATAPAGGVEDVKPTAQAPAQGDVSFEVVRGMTSEQIVARLSENDGFAGSVREIPREGTLLPGSYKFPRGTKREQVIQEMREAQQKALAEIWERRNPDVPVKSQEALVTLASIVEMETGKDDERARMAAVFVNRLRQRMKLQSDPTIVYGLVGGKGTLGRPIKRAEIIMPTPYNTYVIEGLPPGPITNPSRASLEAAANPARSRDLFFVADGIGGHVFTDTYDAHQKNVARLRSMEKQIPNDTVEPAGTGAPAAAGPAPSVPVQKRARENGVQSSTLPAVQR